MSKGSNFKPCMRKNGKIMMRVNPEPVIIDFDTAVQFLFYGSHWEYPVKTKKNIQERIARVASYYNYHGYIEDTPQNYEEALEWYGNSNSGYDSKRLYHYMNCQMLIEKYFPEFKK